MKNSRIIRIASLASILTLFSICAISCFRQLVQTDPPASLIETSKVVTSFVKTVTPVLVHIVTSTKNPIDPAETPTGTPVISETPARTVIKTKPKMDNRYILANDNNQALYLVDSQTGKFRILESEEIDPIRLVAFVGDGCSLIVRLDDKSIVQVDLKARVIKELLPSNWYQGQGVAYGEILSASEEWIAYGVGQGLQGYNSWEYQDIETMHLIDRVVFRLSEHGGARVFAWAPDGLRIAFSDYDENNVQQIYISKRDGKEKKQLTQFNQQDGEVRLLRWSPDGTKLAFQQLTELDHPETLGMILVSESLPFITYTVVPPGVKNFWWDGDEVLVILTEFDEVASEIGEGAIVWLDTTTRQLVNSLRESDIIKNNIITAGYFGQSKLFLISDSGFFIYDPATGVMLQEFGFFLPYSDLKISPMNFPGEDQCTIPFMLSFRFQR